MKQRLAITVESLRIGEKRLEFRAWQRQKTASAVYRPDADRCETSLQYLEYLFELETKIALKDGETDMLVVLDWKTTGISSRIHSTQLSVDNSSKNYIVFNCDGLAISPWRIWTWQIVKELFGRLTYFIWKPSRGLAFGVEVADNMKVEIEQQDKKPTRSEVVRENSDPRPNSWPFSTISFRNSAWPGRSDDSEHQEEYRRLDDCPCPPHYSFDQGPFDRKSPLVRDDNQVRDTCAQSSNQRAGGGASPDAVLGAQGLGDGGGEASDGDDDSDSDLGDDYWTWDPLQQVLWHRDTTTNEVVHCPETFD